MKRFIIVFTFFSMILGIPECVAQTYCYKYLFYVSKNGVRKNCEKPSYIYLTFANSNKTIYESDENGSYNGSAGLFEHYYLYQKTENRVHIYRDTYPKCEYADIEFGGDILYLSEDFRRINIKTLAYLYPSLHGDTKVYEYVERAPSQTTPMY